mmetsp:Transcript_66576/g.216663  ORF Transcript_66576/g.216663 Transcript_66576/m.216663 type:complete len:310 (-) Transcript_66576:185-1114(-)
MHLTAALPADPTWAAPFRWLIASRRTLTCVQQASLPSEAPPGWSAFSLWRRARRADLLGLLLLLLAPEFRPGRLDARWCWRHRLLGLLELPLAAAGWRALSTAAGRGGRGHIGVGLKAGWRREGGRRLLLGGKAPADFRSGLRNALRFMLRSRALNGLGRVFPGAGRTLPGPSNLRRLLDRHRLLGFGLGVLHRQVHLHFAAASHHHLLGARLQARRRRARAAAEAATLAACQLRALLCTTRRRGAALALSETTTAALAKNRRRVHAPEVSPRGASSHGRRGMCHSHCEVRILGPNQCLLPRRYNHKRR